MESTAKTITPRFFDNITRENIEQRIGYTSGAEVSPRIVTLIDEYLETAKNLISPTYTYSIQSVQQVDTHRVLLGRNLVLESGVIGKVLQHCTKAAVFALTIGKALESETARLGENGLILEAFILDTIGSGLAEKMADFVQGIIGEMANLQGMAISRRFSPGYCDWHIDQQKVVFCALGEEAAGIVLSEDLIMTPEKSVSGIIGIEPAENGVASYNPCRECAKHACLWRRI